MKTELRPEKIDDCSGNVVSTEKFSFYIHTTSLLRLCHVLTASNAFPLSSYHGLFTRSPRPVRSYYVLTMTIQIALSAYHAFTTRAPRPVRSYYDHSDRTTRKFEFTNCVLPDLIITIPRAPRSRSFCKCLCHPKDSKRCREE